MNSAQIAAVTKKAGAKVVQNSEHMIVIKDKNGLNHRIVPERSGGTITDKNLLKRLGGKPADKKVSNKKSVPTPGGENFAAFLEAIKGVGPSSAKKLAAVYNKKSLKAALEADEDIGLGGPVTAVLKKWFL